MAATRSINSCSRRLPFDFSRPNHTQRVQSLAERAWLTDCLQVPENKRDHSVPTFTPLDSQQPLAQFFVRVYGSRQRKNLMLRVVTALRKGESRFILERNPPCQTGKCPPSSLRRFTRRRGLSSNLYELGVKDNSGDSAARGYRRDKEALHQDFDRAGRNCDEGIGEGLEACTQNCTPKQKHLTAFIRI